MQFEGEPILIVFRPRLSAWRGGLLYGEERGCAVHAGTFLYERRIVLDQALLRKARELDRVLAHEIFHFVWWKLRRELRAGYEALIASEFLSPQAGEMGWSAECRKSRLSEDDRRNRRRSWRDYVCESFCDTAAAFALRLDSHPEITLRAAARHSRNCWLAENLDLERLRT